MCSVFLLPQACPTPCFENKSLTHTPLSSSSGLAFQNLPSTAHVSILDLSWWVTLCASVQKCTCTVFFFVLHLEPRWKDAKRKSSRPIKMGVAPLPNPIRELHFSSPQTDEGLQTEPFFIILLVFSIFTPPTARTWDTFLKTSVPEIWGLGLI